MVQTGHISALAENTKRITLFMPAFSGGGAERVMIALANNFDSQNINVDMVVLASDGPYIHELSKGVRIVDLGVNRAMRGIIPFARYLKKNKPEVVLVTMKQVALCAYFARRLTFGASKTRLLIREAVSPTFSEMHQGVSVRIMSILLRYVYKDVDAVISTTPEMTDELSARYQFKRLLTIGNPVATKKFRALMNQRADCHWPWPKNEKLVLSVGRLGRQKDFSTLIKAFALANQELPARLAILGEGELRPEIEAQIASLGIEDRVWLPGFVENPFAYMASCDLYVMSSIGEGLPNALIQALCTGTPVVSTSCPTGPKDLLEDGKYGHLVDIGDFSAMAECIVHSLTHESKNVTRQNHFLKKFDVQTISDLYLKALLD